jgi:hypothetical protein
MMHVIYINNDVLLSPRATLYLFDGLNLYLMMVTVGAGVCGCAML